MLPLHINFIGEKVAYINIKRALEELDLVTGKK